MHQLYQRVRTSLRTNASRANLSMQNTGNMPDAPCLVLWLVQLSCGWKLIENPAYLVLPLDEADPMAKDSQRILEKRSFQRTQEMTARRWDPYKTCPRKECIHGLGSSSCLQIEVGRHILECSRPENMSDHHCSSMSQKCLRSVAETLTVEVRER
jgi:hypothetical protein